MRGPGSRDELSQHRWSERNGVLSTLSWIDWAIMAVAVVALRLVSLHTRRYMRGIADFLSANRSAGRYLLTIATHMGGFGVVTFVGMFEVAYTRGLAPNWWTGFMLPAGVIIVLTGWVYYRFRETRAMTMAQFLEMRYSRRFRVFAGMVCWTSGVINFGIFPAVAARFLIYFCGLPESFSIPGVPFDLPTFPVVMGIDLALALSFVMLGGQISVMITDCVQGIFCSIAFIVVAVAIMVSVQWPQMVQALSIAPENQSMINPFKTGAVDDFNVFYYLISVFGTFYGYMSWQGSQGFFSSARTPHEQKMGSIIGIWRTMPQNLVVTLMPLAALAVMKLPEFSANASLVNAALKSIDNDVVRGQMVVPIVMANILPIGVKGLLATIFLFFSFTCHDTYLHSWGSIFVQDVYLPLRRKALSPERHIQLLRWSAIFVGVFAFFFSLLYQPNEKILMFFAITGVIWLGGSGAVIVGGLYWRKGTTAGAYSALILGAILGVGGLIVPRIYQARTGSPFPVNNQYLYMLGMVGALIVYVVVSLLTGRGARQVNMDRLLHRGKYTIASDDVEMSETGQSVWMKLSGITTEFSRSDRVLAVALVAWNMLNFAWFVVFSAANIVGRVSDSAWAAYWHTLILVQLALCVPVTVWFTIGGLIDTKAIFKTLATATRDSSDDGRVKDEGLPEADEAGIPVACEPDMALAGVAPAVREDEPDDKSES